MHSVLVTRRRPLGAGRRACALPYATHRTEGEPGRVPRLRLHHHPQRRFPPPHPIYATQQPLPLHQVRAKHIGVALVLGYPYQLDMPLLLHTGRGRVRKMPCFDNRPDVWLHILCSRHKRTADQTATKRFQDCCCGRQLRSSCKNRWPEHTSAQLSVVALGSWCSLAIGPTTPVQTYPPFLLQRVFGSNIYNMCTHTYEPLTVLHGWLCNRVRCFVMEGAPGPNCTNSRTYGASR